MIIKNDVLTFVYRLQVIKLYSRNIDIIMFSTADMRKYFHARSSR